MNKQEAIALVDGIRRGTGEAFAITYRIVDALGAAQTARDKLRAEVIWHKDQLEIERNAFRIDRERWVKELNAAKNQRPDPGDAAEITRLRYEIDNLRDMSSSGIADRAVIDEQKEEIARLQSDLMAIYGAAMKAGLKLCDRKIGPKDVIGFLASRAAEIDRLKAELASMLAISREELNKKIYFAMEESIGGLFLSSTLNNWANRVGEAFFSPPTAAVAEPAAGIYYTPPGTAETVDPACGTGSFLKDAVSTRPAITPEQIRDMTEKARVRWNCTTLDHTKETEVELQYRLVREIFTEALCPPTAAAAGPKDKSCQACGTIYKDGPCPKCFPSQPAAESGPKASGK